MDLDQLTLGQIKQLSSLNIGSAKAEHPFQIGKSYMIRTVTMNNVGEVVAIKGDFLVLKNCAWIADSGRFHDFLKNGPVSNACEIEPMQGEVFVNMKAIVDVSEWNHGPLLVQK